MRNKQVLLNRELLSLKREHSQELFLIFMLN